MKKWVLVIGLSVMLCGSAEAGMGDALKNTWSYLFAPVNCLGNFVKDVGKSALGTVQCILNNANRNPVTLTPIIQ